MTLPEALSHADILVARLQVLAVAYGDEQTARDADAVRVLAEAVRPQVHFDQRRAAYEDGMCQAEAEARGLI